MTKESCNIKGFNFCFWSKMIIGIPALILAGYIAASFFTNGYAQMLAAVVVVLALVWLALKVERMPMFSSKVVQKDQTDSDKPVS